MTWSPDDPSTRPCTRRDDGPLPPPNEWAWLGLALGLAAVLMAPAPLVGLVFSPLAPTGLVMALGGVAAALRGRGGGIVAVIAVLLCAVGVLLSLLYATAGQLPAAPPITSTAAAARPDPSPVTTTGTPTFDPAARMLETRITALTTTTGLRQPLPTRTGVATNAGGLPAVVFATCLAALVVMLP